MVAICCIIEQLFLILCGEAELRISVPNKELRILFIYDGETLVILFNCFVKKTQKTPGNEIKKAIRLMSQYYEEKRKQ